MINTMEKITHASDFMIAVWRKNHRFKFVD
jgi:hypothetical protein